MGRPRRDVMTDIQSQPIITSRASDTTMSGPHWSPLKEIDALELGSHTHDSLDELLAEVTVVPIPLTIRAEILQSGLNVALNRWTKVDVLPLNLPKSPGMLPTWKPT